MLVSAEMAAKVEWATPERPTAVTVATAPIPVSPVRVVQQVLVWVPLEPPDRLGRVGPPEVTVAPAGQGSPPIRWRLVGMVVSAGTAVPTEMVATVALAERSLRLFSPRSHLVPAATVVLADRHRATEVTAVLVVLRLL